MKLTVIGAGGFRMPALYTSLLDAADRLSIDELALHDTSDERLGRIGPVLEGLEQEHGSTLPRRATTSLDEAVDGADFVFSAVRAGGVAGRLVDESVPVRHGVVGQETTGPGGLAFALRTVPVMQRIAALIGERAPKAVIINFTNPAGLVTEAMQRVLGSSVIGICDAPPDLCRRVATAVGRPRESLRFEYSGLNHLAWMTGVFDRGEDLLPALLVRQRAAGRDGRGPVVRRRVAADARLDPERVPLLLLPLPRGRGDDAHARDEGRVPRRRAGRASTPGRRRRRRPRSPCGARRGPGASSRTCSTPSRPAAPTRPPSPRLAPT